MDDAMPSPRGKDKALPTDGRHPVSKLSLQEEILRATGRTSYVAVTHTPSPVIIVITQLAFVCTSAGGFSAQCNLLLVYVGSFVVPF